MLVQEQSLTGPWREVTDTDKFKSKLNSWLPCCLVVSQPRAYTVTDPSKGQIAQEAFVPRTVQRFPDVLEDASSRLSIFFSRQKIITKADSSKESLLCENLTGSSL